MLEKLNSYLPHDGKLRLHCIHHEECFIKSDAYLVECDGSLLLIDSGMPNSKTSHIYLNEIRRKCLKNSGLDESSDIPLHLTWLASHFHGDHVGAFTSTILPDPHFVVDKLILPPDSALDPYFNTTGVDGDERYRPQLKEALEKFGTGKEDIVNINFGSENIYSFTLPTGTALFTVYPPVADGGVRERLQYMIDGYYDGNKDHHNVATAAVNSCSIWLKVNFGEHTFLLTGDTMKRELTMPHEAADEMVEAYLDSIGEVTVLKYLHHGYKRDAAAELMMKFNPRHVIVSCEIQTATEALKVLCGENCPKTYNCAFRDIVFESDGKNITVAQTPI